jgi:hypothetical protein
MESEPEMTTRSEHGISYIHNGLCEARIAASVLLLFRVETLSDAELQSAFDTALQPLRSQMNSLRTDEVIRKRSVPQGEFDMVERWLGGSMPKRRPLSLELSSSQHDEDVAEYLIRLRVPMNNIEHERGLLQISLPSAVGLAGSDRLRTLALRLAGMLPLVWCQAGFGIEYQSRRIIEERDRRIAAWHARYRCVQFSDPDDVAISAYNGLPGVSWINIVSKQLVDDRLGGQQFSGIGGTPLGDRLRLFEASGAPILGDRNRSEDVTDYARLGLLLQDLLCDRPAVLPGSDEDAQEMDWLERFQ